VIKRKVAMMLLVILLTGILFACSTADSPLAAAELLDLGEKYLLELNYEQALVQFLKVIEIEPMNPRGYTGAAEAYVGLGQPDNAAEILRQGLTTVEHEDARTMTEMLEMLDKSESEEEVTAADDTPGSDHGPTALENFLAEHRSLFAPVTRIENEFGEIQRALDPMTGAELSVEDTPYLWDSSSGLRESGFFSLFDLDNNGIPVVIIQPSGFFAHYDGSRLYRYSDGEYRYMGEISRGISFYSDNEGRIIQSSGEGGYAWADYITFSGHGMELERIGVWSEWEDEDEVDSWDSYELLINTLTPISQLTSLEESMTLTVSQRLRAEGMIP
jgi:hypothetical protein